MNMRKIIMVVSYIPAVLLSLTFLSNGFKAIRLADEFLGLVLILGFNQTISSILLLTVGIVDCFIAGLILFKSKILPGLNWRFVFLYAGLWPVVPRILEWYQTGVFPFIEAAIFISVAALAYFLCSKDHFATAPLQENL